MAVCGTYIVGVRRTRAHHTRRTTLHFLHFDVGHGFCVRCSTLIILLAILAPIVFFTFPFRMRVV